MVAIQELSIVTWINFFSTERVTYFADSDFAVRLGKGVRTIFNNKQELKGKQKMFNHVSYYQQNIASLCWTFYEYLSNFCIRIIHKYIAGWIFKMSKNDNDYNDYDDYKFC